MQVLGIDPGSAKLGFAFVTWNGFDYSDESNYSVKWMCLINLNDSFEKKEKKQKKETTNESGITTRYEEMHGQMDRLNEFLENNATLNRILKIPGLVANIEQQEGARDINVLFKLMRVNFVSGIICRYLKEKKVPVSVVPKTFKCGWSFASSLAKKMTARVISKSRRKGVDKTKENLLTKKHRKEIQCAFVRRIVNMDRGSEETKKDVLRCKDADFNHMADGASQAIRHIKERVYYEKFDPSKKKYKDEISKKMKEHLNGLFDVDR